MLMLVEKDAIETNVFLSSVNANVKLKGGKIREFTLHSLLMLT